MAVTVEGGLITPIVREAHAKGLAQISSEMKDLASRAKKVLVISRIKQDVALCRVLN